MTKGKDKTKTRQETVEEYLARGGVITRLPKGGRPERHTIKCVTRGKTPRVLGARAPHKATKRGKAKRDKALEGLSPMERAARLLDSLSKQELFELLKQI